MTTAPAEQAERPTSRHLRSHTLLGSIWWCRWGAVVLCLALVVFYRPAPDAVAGFPRFFAAVLVAALAAVNVLEWKFGDTWHTTHPRQWALAQVVVDAVVSVLFVAACVGDMRLPMWIFPVLPLIHAGVRFQLHGCIVAWCGVSVAYAATQWFAQVRFGSSLSAVQICFHALLYLIVAVAFGVISASLRLRERQVDALRSVANVTQHMTSMDSSTLVDELTVAALKVGFIDLQMFTLGGDPPYWSMAHGSQPETNIDEDPSDIHLWCTDLTHRIGDRNRPMYMRPQDALASYRFLDWGKTQVLVAPVRSGKDLFAIIVVSHPDPIPGYRKRTLQLLAAHAGAALANARRYAERQRYERRLAHQATHDALTRLPNRVLLQQRLTAALKRTRGTQVRTAVLLLDLDRFKEINDTLGHDYGDQLLMQVSERLAAIMRTGDVAARLGGDEFAVLITGLIDVDDAVAMANRVLRGVHQPFLVDGVTLDVEVSIGVAVSPEHGDTVEDLMRCADVAMYIAKRATLGVSVYDSAADVHTPKRLALLGDMRRALETRDQLLLYYQPAIDVATGQLVGVEALLRWDHPHHGLVPPGQFISGAEGTGLIHALSRYVLEVAMDQAQQWARLGHNIPIAVNLSTRILMDQTLPEQVQQVLSDRGLASSALRLEITESSIMSDPERAIGVLNRLDALGVSMSIDDFGTGYSSMTYLKHLPVDEIKIDQSFVFSMLEQNKDAMLVRSLVELGHNLGLSVVAEGVENAATLAALQELGCDVAQGFHVAKPMPVESFNAWLRQSGVGDVGGSQT